jgi:hypothetical protein
LLHLSVTFFSANVFASVDTPVLTSSTELATAGFYTLSWSPGANDYELQQSDSSDFQQPQAVYTGPDTATVISGKPDGVRYYRVRNIDNGQAGSWSQVVRVTVQHHTLTRAFLFLFTGMVVFLATILLITIGARKHGEQH